MTLVTLWYKCLSSVTTDIYTQFERSRCEKTSKHHSDCASIPIVDREIARILTACTLSHSINVKNDPPSSSVAHTPWNRATRAIVYPARAM